MIRYASNVRQYPQYQPVGTGIDGVFRWYSVGSGGAIPPPPPQTHKRLYHNWLVYGDQQSDIFVWQSAGTTGGTPVTTMGFFSLFAFWLGGVGSFNPTPPPATTHIAGYPNVTPYMPDEREHRRQIAAVVNSIRSGKLNITLDVTLTANAVTTTITDARIGVNSAIIPAMPLTSDGALALTNGIWVTAVITGQATINHASSANTDQTIKFLIIG